MLQRRFLARVVRVVRAGLSGAVHSLIHSELAEDAAEVAARLASAVIRPRAEPAAALAALSHMLMNGFFFNQGLDMSISGVCSAIVGGLSRQVPEGLARGLVGSDAIRIENLTQRIGLQPRTCEVPADMSASAMRRPSGLLNPL
ncbi:hypothetical protein [Variovorax sp. JS1663]|uniref:hypothetical protein n=1 Tax=Variovorax sp. JS1663 TaxID=1851577 RepID=UPI000B74BCDC|nr:hypothetical protein A8M77_12585 [Variovorax sp. JS1663]